MLRGARRSTRCSPIRWMARCSTRLWVASCDSVMRCLRALEAGVRGGTKALTHNHEQQQAGVSGKAAVPGSDSKRGVQPFAAITLWPCGEFLGLERCARSLGCRGWGSGCTAVGQAG